MKRKVLRRRPIYNGVEGKGQVPDNFRCAGGASARLGYALSTVIVGWAAF